MKRLSPALFLVLLLVGCSTVSTIERRSQEKNAAWTAASPVQQRLMARGLIARDFTADMVYVALDKPDRVNRGTDGRSERWYYFNFGRSPTTAYMGGTKITTLNPNPTPRGAAKNYYQNTYTTRAEPAEEGDAWQDHLVITFLDGKVASIELFKM